MSPGWGGGQLVQSLQMKNQSTVAMNISFLKTHRDSRILVTRDLYS